MDAAEPRIRVEVSRSGGMAGMTRRAVADTGELPAERAAQLRALVARVDFDRTGDGGHPSGPDRFSYQLRVDIGPRSHRISAGERDAPAAVRALADYVIGQGIIGT